MLKYNKQKVQYVVATIVALSMSGCSWFSTKDGTEDIDDRYMQSKQGPELQMPPNNSSLKINDDQYRVPEGAVITQREAKGKNLNLEPPQLLLIGGDGIREDKDQEHPTVWLRNSGTEVMEYIKRFTTEKNIPVVSSSEKSLATDWISDINDDAAAQYLGSYNIEGQRHKFVLDVFAQSQSEVGLQAVHSANQQLVDDSWVEVETSEKVAKQFLNHFLGYYDSLRTKEARARILEEGSISFNLGVDDKGQMAMVTDKNLLTVWEQTPRVLKSLNLELTDRDQSSRIYYFKVREPDSGLWDGLFGTEDDDVKVELEPGDYQIKVVEMMDKNVALTFHDSEGNLLEQSIVAKIYPEFSAHYRSRAVTNQP